MIEHTEKSLVPTSEQVGVRNHRPLISKGDMAQRVANVNGQSQWFADPRRCQEDNLGPYLIIKDDFYADPLQVRELALSQAFVPFDPPAADRVGERIAQSGAGAAGTWLTSWLEVYQGARVQNPFHGFRLTHDISCSAAPPLRKRMEHIVGESVDEASWDWMGDGWNGAFHQIDAGWRRTLVHHHYKQFDLVPRGWSGLVYLNVDAPPEAGTSLWLDKLTGLCVAEFGPFFKSPEEQLPGLPAAGRFDLVLSLENKFNRLVLFRENVLHSVAPWPASRSDRRLTQTFFFRTAR
jgi:hypothetical protein